MADDSHLRHYGGFLVAGGSAFLTDVAVFQALVAIAGLGLLVARFLSISTAMVVSFLINRRLTFRMPGPPRLAEFLRFVAVAWLSSGFNFVIFAAVMFARPQTAPTIAIVIATAISMITSYLGMRLAVFHKG